MSIELLLSFLSASVILTIIPGPDNIFVLTESITNGKKTGIAISFGLASGVLVHTFAAAAGISIIVQKSAIAFSVIKYLGAGYLFYMAIMAFKDKKSSIDLKHDQPIREKSFLQLMRKGFFMNVLNPKVALFFLAFLPQFISSNGIKVEYQMIILGLVFIGQTIIIFCIIAVLTGSLAEFLNSPRFWKITKWSKVSVLSILGLALILSKK